MANERVPIEPFPPGDLIREELGARGWSQSDFAEILGRTPAFVSEIIAGKRGITLETAQALADAFETSAQWWLNMESSYRLALSRSKKDSGVKKRARLYAKAPVREIIKRGWLEPSANPDVLEQHVCRFLGINNLDETPAVLPYAARQGGPHFEPSPAQIAWHIRARHLASSIHVAPHSKKSFAHLMPQLKAFLEDPEDLRRVPTTLAEAGVRLLILEPLPGTQIDGACLWLDAASPVVVVSLRYDRIDAFWYTLMHELAHVFHQDGLAARPPLDVNLLGEGKDHDRPKFETRADEWAEAALISQGDLEAFIARVGPLFSKKKIREFATMLGVNPGIVVGQLQHREVIQWSHSREMLVKVRDIVTQSALTDGWGHRLPVLN